MFSDFFLKNVWGRKMKKGMGKVEFRAVSETVEKMLAQGYNIKMIYEHLREAGKIAMSYRTFWRYTKTEMNQPTKTYKTGHTQALQKNQGQGRGQSGQGFHHDPLPDKDRLI